MVFRYAWRSWREDGKRERRALWKAAIRPNPGTTMPQDKGRDSTKRTKRTISERRPAQAIKKKRRNQNLGVETAIRQRVHSRQKKRSRQKILGRKTAENRRNFAKVGSLEASTPLGKSPLNTRNEGTYGHQEGRTGADVRAEIQKERAKGFSIREETESARLIDWDMWETLLSGSLQVMFRKPVGKKRSQVGRGRPSRSSPEGRKKNTRPFIYEILETGKITVAQGKRNKLEKQ